MFDYIIVCLQYLAIAMATFSGCALGVAVVKYFINPDDW